MQGETLSCLVDFNHILCLCLINYLQRVSKGSKCGSTPCECTLPLISYLMSFDVPKTTTVFLWLLFRALKTCRFIRATKTPAISNHLKLRMLRFSQLCKKVERWPMPTCQKLFLGRRFFSDIDDTFYEGKRRRSIRSAAIFDTCTPRVCKVG